jgi:dihydrofolate reductase
MQIRARMSMSADGYVTTPSGWPALTADPAFVSGQSHGIREFLQDCEAALMGRTTFEPALTNERWPWPSLNVFVLASHRPEGTPNHVVTDSDPERLLEKLRAANNGGDVHLVGGPLTGRDLPCARRARQARARRAPVAVRRRAAPHVVTQHRHGAGLRGRARAAGWVGGDRLRRQHAPERFDRP